MADPVSETLARLKKTGRGKLVSAGAVSDVKCYIPTGVDVLDHYILGTGGLAAGRLTELYSDPGGGKTSLLFRMLAGVQSIGGIGVLVETEHALESCRMDVFGCDREQLILLDECKTLEDVAQALPDIMASLPGDVPAVVGWDSIAQTPTAAELSGKNDAGMGDKPKQLNKLCRVLCSQAVEKTAALVFINQTREKVGVHFGNPITTPGGVGPKFMASVRLHVMGGAKVEGKDGSRVGQDVTIMSDKNKIVSPHRTARFRFLYETGWDNLYSTIKFAKDRGLIPAGSRLTPAMYHRSIEALGWAYPFDAPQDVEGSKPVKKTGLKKKK